MKKILLYLLISSTVFADTKEYLIAYHSSAKDISNFYQVAIDYTKKLFKTAGIKYKLVDTPLKRSIHQIEHNQVDIDVLRTERVAKKLIEKNPSIGMIQYPFFETAAIFSSKQTILRYKNFNELKNSNMKVACLRGTKVCEHLIKKNNIVYVNRVEQIPKIIERGRLDYGLIGQSTKDIIEREFKNLGLRTYWGPQEKSKINFVFLLSPRAKIELYDKLKKTKQSIIDKQAF